MASTSIENLVLLIVAIVVATGVALAATGSISKVTQAVDNRGDIVADSISTDVEIISDPGSTAIYNESSTTVTILVKNTGQTTLSKSPSSVDILIDGTYETPESIEVVGSATTWKPGETARIKINRDLNAGSHRVLAVVNGGKDLIRFNV